MMFYLILSISMCSRVTLHINVLRFNGLTWQALEIMLLSLLATNVLTVPETPCHDDWNVCRPSSAPRSTTRRLMHTCHSWSVWV